MLALRKASPADRVQFLRETLEAIRRLDQEWGWRRAAVREIARDLYALSDRTHGEGSEPDAVQCGVDGISQILGLFDRDDEIIQTYVGTAAELADIDRLDEGALADTERRLAEASKPPARRQRARGVKAVALVALVVAAGACAEPTGHLDDVYLVEWEVAPKALLGCDTLVMDDPTLWWSGPECDEPALTGADTIDGCRWYPGAPGAGYEWRICEDIGRPGDLVGKRIEGGQLVADFTAAAAP